MKKIIYLIVILLLNLQGMAQDQQFTQFYAVPTVISPAFAGASVQSRLSAQYRNQWAAIPGGFSAFNMSYDQFLPNINSGMGLLVNYDRAGTGALRTSSVSFQYSYEARIKRNWYFRPALQFGYVTKNIDFDKLTFYDQMMRDGAAVSLEQGTIRPVSYFDMGAGLLTYGPKFWFGISAYHNNSPDQSFYTTNENPLARKVSAHGGVRLRIKGNSLMRLDHYVVLAANYLSQQNFDQLDFGFYYEFSPIILGVWYRGLPMKSNNYGYVNHDAVAVLLGFQASRYKFGYSYDITVSRLGIGSSSGSHELSLTYQWSNKHNNRSKKIRIMPCAKF
ncbi:MAG: PorP/SprF family type IX secretion system membrane protein [Flavobacteriales bacterium]|nr:PorP/SprF family type IX secretion system membrane protein [Flavobacteriales bacterium]